MLCCAYCEDLSQLSMVYMNPAGCVIRSSIQLSGHRFLVLAQRAKTEMRAATSHRLSVQSGGKLRGPAVSRRQVN